MAHYVHHVPGRLRVRLTRLKRNPALAERLRGSLAQIPGVGEVRTNLVTGSLLVSYDAAVTPRRRLFEHLMPAGVEPLARAPLPHRRRCPACQAPQSPLPSHLTSDGGALGRKLLEMAVEHSAKALFAALL